MEAKKVPQDNISTYANNAKAVYATDENGDYSVVASTGWEVEEEVTKQALNEFERQAQVAYNLVRTGEKSPLYYHMFAQRMDLMVLAQSVGWFQWRVKRHFSPKIFAKLSPVKLSAYSDALGISVKQLTKLPNLSNKNK
ncbi:hypothetical protein ERW49_01420 [Aliivibrio finisterrensis]|uniref:Uncharacterized protein n=1 Tax=Aliivibrio finisterrensis TaxID=511998 RepID=A0A4Q5KPW5_9GAMM|nr:MULTISPECIES: hypothetical protein [Aliivibrio]MDD9174704.1 hypothetical protein [Aliivibrio sp. S3TY1]MDD9191783.1 hypothetical protein [Aliivibrio sp. S2TY2]RYU48654.1 hypothetical protein ERW49_01420 [Aliivibrio finisterrensis]